MLSILFLLINDDELLSLLIGYSYIFFGQYLCTSFSCWIVFLFIIELCEHSEYSPILWY